MFTKFNEIIAGYIYRFRNKKGKIIYVGKTKNTVESRMGNHKELPVECYRAVKSVEYISVGYFYDLSKVEQYYINKYKPKYNKYHVDDKNKISEIMLDEKPWYVLDEKYHEHFKTIEKRIASNPDSKIGKQLKTDNIELRVRERYDKNNEQKRRKRRNNLGLLNKEQSKLNNIILVKQLSLSGMKNKDIVNITGLTKGTVSRYLKIDVSEYLNKNKDDVDSLS